MHHYSSVLLLQITICNVTDGEHNSGVTIQSCSGAWMWLIIILVIISCTDLFLCFLHLFSNLVPVLFTPVQLCTCLIFWENFYMLILTCDAYVGSLLNLVQSTETYYTLLLPQQHVLCISCKDSWYANSSPPLLESPSVQIIAPTYEHKTHVPTNSIGL